MGSPRKHIRAAIAERLLRVAIALTLVPLVTNILFLVAGTYQVQDSTRSGAKRIGLSSLAITSFKGIIPSGTSIPSYLVNLQYFPSAFTYSYPSSPSISTTSGILQSGPSPSFDPYTLIQLLPSIFALPPSDTSCLSHAPSPNRETDSARCSTFWLAVQRTASSSYRFRLNGFYAKFSFATHLSAIVIILYLYCIELTMRYRPGWMRCQCWFAWQRRWCPLPKGTPGEVARLPDNRWDKVRLWWYSLVLAYCIIPIHSDTQVGYFFMRSLGWFEKLLPEGETVDAKMGRGFLVVGWGGVMVAIVALGCVIGRFYLTKRQPEKLKVEDGRPLLSEKEDGLKDI